ncbi:MAG: right-handed parallel beta-helix repeat-containing protein, partial [Cytophagales bacterium]|nr:right-handed parallel beta-helix repeat-containing protein [Cytophagales bacterium]
MKIIFKSLLILSLGIFIIPKANGTVYTVTSVSDFYVKYNSANSDPTPDIIKFNIQTAGNPWNIVQLSIFSGYNNTSGFQIRFPLTIDGANMFVNGPKISILNLSIIGATDVTIKNLIIGNSDPTVDMAVSDLIYIQSSSNVIIGGDVANGNELRSYCYKGIYINSSQNIKISGNNLSYPRQPFPGIGCNPSGQDGIYIDGSSNVVIGGQSILERNIISGHNNNAIYLYRSDNVVIQNNYLGTNVLGDSRV